MSHSADPRGQPLIAQISDPAGRVEALAQLAEVVAGVGNRDRAAQLIDEAEALIPQVTGQNEWALTRVLARLAKVMAANGDHYRARARIAQIADPVPQLKALIRLLEGIGGGDQNGIARLIDEAEALIPQITDPAQRVGALVELVKVMAAGGDHERSIGLAGEAETLAAQISDPSRRVRELARLAEAVAVGGNPDRAEELISQITNLAQREFAALVQLVEAVAISGDHDRAEELASQITDRELRALALVRLVELTAPGGDHDCYARLANQAEAVIPWPTQMWALVRLAAVAAAGGDHDRVARLAIAVEGFNWRNKGKRYERDDNPWEYVRDQEQGWAGFVAIVTVSGDHDRAEMLAGLGGAPDARARALVGLAEAVAATGNHDRASRLLDEAKTLAEKIIEPGPRVEALAWLTKVLAGTGKKSLLVREHALSGPPLMVQTRHLLAAALVTASWTEVVISLARFDPATVNALANELQVRWGLDPDKKATAISCE